MMIRTGRSNRQDDPFRMHSLIPILLRLPIKSLLRFKAASKNWYEFIRSPYFIDLHTNFVELSSSIKQNQLGSFIFIASFYKYVESVESESESVESESVSFQSLKEDKVVFLSSSQATGSRENNEASQSRSQATTGSFQFLKEEDKVIMVSSSKATTTGLITATDLMEEEEEMDDELMFKVDILGFSDYSKFFPGFCTKNIVGSCNGLICLYDASLEDFYLWNPATRHFKTLPKAIQIPSKSAPRHLVGFGFDAPNDDYKVVRLTTFRSTYYRTASPPIDCLCRVQVYSSRTDSWNLLQGITSLPGFPFFSSYPTTTEIICLNGSCFFLAQFFRNQQQKCYPNRDRFLISLNLNNYVITPIQLPDHHRQQKLYLTCLGDNKLALFIVGSILPMKGDYYYPDVYILGSPPPLKLPKIYHPPRGIFYSQVCCTDDYNVWVLDEQVSSSKEDSWRHLHSFQMEHETPDQWSLPICISNNGKFVLIGTAYSIGLSRNMKLYNLVTKEVTKDLFCDQVTSKAYGYKPSLVECWEAAT